MKSLINLLRITVLLAVVAFMPAAFASGPVSASYAIPWEVIDAGGGVALSPSYIITDSIAQTTAVGTSLSASFIVTGGFHTPPDYDEDNLKNFLDNCIFEPNSDQRDSNADGYGNVCDPDLNDDGVVNTIDLGILKLRFFTADPDADFDGNGVVNAVDLGILKARFFGMPGPSGIAP